MYDNRKHVKDLRVNLRISEVEYKRLEDIADKQGSQKATLARQALIELMDKLEAQYELETTE